MCGGAEAAIHPMPLAAFASMQALSRRNDDPQAASRPFDKGRDGFVPGALAELIGYGATADASHITLPAPGGIGAVRAARRAIAKAGIDTGDIDHVNAHATSTPQGDEAELQAIRTLLGEHAPGVSITANKSMLGHTLGAAGAIEAVTTIMTIRDSCVPPTINLEDPDDEAHDLDIVANHAKAQDVRIALSNSFGFGGQNTALIFRRWEE